MGQSLTIETTAKTEISFHHIAQFIRQCEDPFELISMLRLSVARLPDNKIKQVLSFATDGNPALVEELRRVATTMEENTLEKVA